MTELGSIYGSTRSGPRGPDLFVSVRPPRPVEGVATRVRVPLELPHEGALVRRADPHGDGEWVALGIPPTLAPGTTLRLRGAGGVSGAHGASAGDLYITIEGFESSPALALLVSRPARRVALAVLAAVAVLLALWSWAA